MVPASVWVSKKQTSTSRSTTEAEVIALAASLFQEAIPMIGLWNIILGREIPLYIMEDNQATMLVIKKGYSAKLRHINRTHKVNLGCLKE